MGTSIKNNSSGRLSIPFDKYNSLGHLRSFLEDHGINSSGSSIFCFNPAHDNKNTPAMTLREDDSGVGKFSCKNPSCNIHGDIYDAVQIITGLDNRVEQYNYVAMRFGGELIGKQVRYNKNAPKKQNKTPAGNNSPVNNNNPKGGFLTPVKTQSSTRPRDELAELSLTRFMADHPDRDRGVREFLLSRGYSEDQITELQGFFLWWPGYPAALEALGRDKLRAAGIPGMKKNKDIASGDDTWLPSTWNNPGAVLPMAVGWKLHFLPETEFFPEGGPSKTGSLGCVSVTTFDGNKHIILTEGEIDKLSVLVQGFGNVYSLGTSSVGDQILELILENNIEQITIMLDGDEAGRIASGIQFMESTGEQSKKCIPVKLRNAGYTGVIRIASLPDREDPDSLYRKGVGIDDYLERAVLFEDILPEHQKVNENIDTDDFWPFRFLGVKNNIHYFISRSQEVISTGAMSMVRQFFIALAPLDFWKSVKVTRSGSPDWEFINDLVYERSVRQGAYDSAHIRGSGIWEDDGEIIYSDGEYVYSESRGTHRVSEFPSRKYTYVMSSRYGITCEQNNNWKEDFKTIRYITETLAFRTPEHGKLLFGWMVSSFFLSIIQWRPIGYMKGPTGVGKSWTMGHIVRRVLGELCISPKKNSTAKGILQAPSYDSRMTTVDEMESSNDKKNQELVKDLLMIARDTTTNNVEKRYVGTGDQQGLSKEFKSMFLFASIVESSEEDQDVNRITAFEFMPRDPGIPWPEISDIIDRAMDEGLGDRIRSDLFWNREVIVRNIKTFCRVSAKKVRSQRNADQLGTLIAGWYALECPGKNVTEEEAGEFVDKFDFSAQEERSHGKMMKVILGSILSYKVRYEEQDGDTVRSRNRAVYDIIKELSERGEDVTRHPLNRELQHFGLRYGTKQNPDRLIVACNHDHVRKMFPDNFSYGNNYKDYLKNHESYCGEERSVRFSGTVYSAQVFEIDLSDGMNVVGVPGEESGKGLF